jgi:hypothetical protein
MATTRGRLVQINQTILDQADFFALDGFTRVQGLTISDVVGQLFFLNQAQPWPLVTGIGVTDAQVVSGKVYFNEVQGSPGYYSIRWRPNALGYWRMSMTYPAGMQVLAQDFDVGQAATPPASGVKASFTKPC